MITAVKTYKELLADHINYRQIEAKLLEMKKELSQLAQFAQKKMSQQTSKNII